MWYRVARIAAVTAILALGLATTRAEAAPCARPGGASFRDAVQACADPERRPVVTATGAAGDAYVCHPFLLHAASWPHRGRAPRFMGQPCIFHQGHDGYRYEAPASPVERAVIRALGGPPVVS